MQYKKSVSLLAVFHKGTLMNIINVTPETLPSFKHLLTDMAGQARVGDVEGLYVAAHVTLELELLETVEAPPDRPAQGVQGPRHVGRDQPL